MWSPLVFHTRAPASGAPPYLSLPSEQSTADSSCWAGPVLADSPRCWSDLAGHCQNRQSPSAHPGLDPRFLPQCLVCHHYRHPHPRSSVDYHRQSQRRSPHYPECRHNPGRRSGQRHRPWPWCCGWLTTAGQGLAATPCAIGASTCWAVPRFYRPGCGVPSGSDPAGSPSRWLCWWLSP